MSEAKIENSLSQDGENKTPAKKTPAKRMSRAKRETEELLKGIGGTVDVDSGRKTRSSTRGTSVKLVIPPPTKKARTETTSRRGRRKMQSVPGEEETKQQETSDIAEKSKVKENNKEKPDKLVISASSTTSPLETSDNKIEKKEESEIDGGKLEIINEEKVDKNNQDSDMSSSKVQEKSKAVTKKETALEKEDENIEEQSVTKDVDDIISCNSTPSSIVEAVEPMEVDSVEQEQVAQPIQEKITVVIDDDNNDKKIADIKDRKSSSDKDFVFIDESNSLDNDITKNAIQPNAGKENSITDKKNDLVNASPCKIGDNKAAIDCEPKLSSQTNNTTGDVVAAQPCI